MNTGNHSAAELEQGTANLEPGDGRLEFIQSFAQGLATKLSIQLGVEVSLNVAGQRTISCRELAQGWNGPAHFTLFKLEPLRGISVLEFSPFISLGMVDRLMGGPGRMPESIHELGEIERLVLEPAVELVLQEWCGSWAKIQELKPVVLGHEGNGRFVQVAAPDTMMFVLALEARFGDCTGLIQMAFPLAAVEPLLAQLNPRREAPKAEAPQPQTKIACQWNACFDEVPLSLTAEWSAMELSAREVLALKVGDVLPMDRLCAQQVEVRLADLPRFLGRPGSMAGQWAVELTEVINR